MMQLVPNVPDKPHRWAREICAWAQGQLVQWRWASPEATDADWVDCDYPSRGVPNWFNKGFEFRVAPVAQPTAPTNFSRRIAELLVKVPLPPRGIPPGVALGLLDELQKITADMERAHHACVTASEETSDV